MLGTINLRLVAVISVLTISFLAGWWINGWRWEAKAYAAEQQLVKQANKTQEIAADYELLRQTKDRKQDVITKEVYIETRKPAYDCRISHSGMLLLHDAVEAANSGKLN